MLGEQTKQVSANGSVTFAELKAGSTRLEITGLAVNCAVGSSTPTAVTVAAGETKQVGVTVACLPRLSTDNSRIVFVSSRATPESFRLSEIYVMNADGTAQTKLTSTGGAYGPSWSPDGARIAFDRGASAEDTDVYIMNRDGTGQARLTTSPGMDVSPHWGPQRP